MLGRVAQARERVLDHHHGAIDHQANRDGQPAQGHQVGAQTDAVHHQESQQGGQDQGGDDDQAGTDVPQENKQDRDHQDDALGQHLGHGLHRGVDQLAAVIKRHDLQAIGQHLLLVDVMDPLLDAAHDLTGVAATDHLHDARHGLGLPILDDGALADFGAKLHVGDVLDQHRRALELLERDVAHVLQGADQTHATDQVLLGQGGQHPTR